MEENLISKKELLALTGISYGALYRWKRKQLIPEEWFIKKSTFTGPETFFPREQVLERIAKIQEMKEELSLDDLAKTFSITPLEMETTPRQLTEEGLLSKAVWGMKGFSETQTLDFHGALYLYICDHLLAEGSLGLAEADGVLAHLLTDFRKFKEPPVLSVYRKMGITFSLLSDEKSEITADQSAKHLTTARTGQLWESFKTKWGKEE